jgi:DNA-binding MarR family transcriptional regulator
MPDNHTALIQQILDQDIHLQRQIYAGWPESWAQVKWPVGSIRALLMIESGFAHTPAEVADVLKISRTTVTGVLDRLENDRLITRTLDPDDRRSFMLEMTQPGRDLVRQIDELRRSQLEQALGSMDGKSLQALNIGLEALIRHMQNNLEIFNGSKGTTEAPVK